MTKLRILAVAATLALSAIAPAQARDAAAQLIDATFERPVHVAVAPGEPNLLFVVEQTGFIRILENEVRLPGKFLNLSSRVACCGEQGLLSMAFAPDYESSGLFYVAYTNPNGDVEVDEFQRDTRLRADPQSRRRVLVVPHPVATNHNGGQLQFGRDGYLYISVGDGGATATPGAPAANLHSLLGKILRIDPRQSDNRPYQIPPDNPFVGTNFRPEIFSYGLRNPWRFTFDGTRIIIGDVGQGRQEEVNFLEVEDAKGANFGWPAWEGNLARSGQPAGRHPPVFPMITYNHNNGRCTVIGGYVMRDPDVPALRGRYIFVDYCEGQIRSVVPNVADQVATGLRFTGISAPQVTSFGKGHGNVIYFTQNTTPGRLSRIVAAP